MEFHLLLHFWFKLEDGVEYHFTNRVLLCLFKSVQVLIDTLDTHYRKVCDARVTFENRCFGKCPALFQKCPEFAKTKMNYFFARRQKHQSTKYI